MPKSELVQEPNAYYDHRTGQRKLHLGGLVYEIRGHRPTYWYELHVTHWDGNEFWLAFIVRGGESACQCYTRFSLTVPFDKLDEVVRTVVEVVRMEERPLPPLVPRDALHP